MQKILAVVAVALIVILGFTVFTILFSEPEEVTEEPPFVDLGDIAPPAPPAETLGEFIKAPPSATQAVLRQEVYEDEFFVEECVEEGDGSRALVLIGQYREINGVNTFVSAEEAMQGFENDAYRDWGPTILGLTYVPSNQPPQVSLSRITDPHVLAESYVRLFHADADRSLYYGWTLNYLVVAPTAACLIETMEGIYHVH